MVPEVASNFELGMTESQETFTLGDETLRAEELKGADFLSIASNTENQAETGRHSYKLQDSLVSNDSVTQTMQGTFN